MKNSLISAVTIIALCLSLSACLKKSDDKDTALAEEYKDRATILSIYTPILGLYEGNLDKDNGESYPVSMKIYKMENSVGVNENGEVKPLPYIVAYFKRDDFISNTIGERFLTVRYLHETNEFIAFTSTGNGMNNPTKFTITGSFIGESIDADVVDQRGYLGHIRLYKVQ